MRIWLPWHRRMLCHRDKVDHRQLPTNIQHWWKIQTYGVQHKFISHSMRWRCSLSNITNITTPIRYTRKNNTYINKQKQTNLQQQQKNQTPNTLFKTDVHRHHTYSATNFLRPTVRATKGKYYYLLPLELIYIHIDAHWFHVCSVEIDFIIACPYCLEA